MHDLPKRPHRWHRLVACGVHFALAVVQATQALLLTGTGASMMSPAGNGAVEVDDPIAKHLERETGGPDRPVGAGL